jgi:hypothetical protein
VKRAENIVKIFSEGIEVEKASLSKNFTYPGMPGGSP